FSTKPVEVIGLHGQAVAIAAGYNHTCALLSGGEVACWGDNAVGQLGNDTTANELYPVRVVGLAHATAISAGGDHSCAIENGGGRCWGGNAGGSLGNGSTVNSSSPVAVGGLTGPVAALSPGTQYTCAVTTSGSA